MPPGMTDADFISIVLWMFIPSFAVIYSAKIMDWYPPTAYGISGVVGLVCGLSKYSEVTGQEISPGWFLAFLGILGFFYRMYLKEWES